MHSKQLKRLGNLEGKFSVIKSLNKVQMTPKTWGK